MLHQWIREKRLAAGLTQTEVAAALCITQPTLSNLESGRSRITVVALQQLAAVLDFDIAEAVRLPVASAEAA